MNSSARVVSTSGRDGGSGPPQALGERFVHRCHRIEHTGAAVAGVGALEHHLHAERVGDDVVVGVVTEAGVLVLLGAIDVGDAHPLARKLAAAHLPDAGEDEGHGLGGVEVLEPGAVVVPTRRPRDRPLPPIRAASFLTRFFDISSPPGIIDIAGDVHRAC